MRFSTHPVRFMEIFRYCEIGLVNTDLLFDNKEINLTQFTMGCMHTYLETVLLGMLAILPAELYQRVTQTQ